MRERRARWLRLGGDALQDRVSTIRGLCIGISAHQKLEHLANLVTLLGYESLAVFGDCFDEVSALPPCARRSCWTDQRPTPHEPTPISSPLEYYNAYVFEFDFIFAARWRMQQLLLLGHTYTVTVSCQSRSALNTCAALEVSSWQAGLLRSTVIANAVLIASIAQGIAERCITVCIDTIAHVTGGVLSSAVTLQH